jgi:hypothetical protein
MTNNRIQSVLFGMQNRTIGPCLADMLSILIPVMALRMGQPRRRRMYRSCLMTLADSAPSLHTGMAKAERWTDSRSAEPGHDFACGKEKQEPQKPSSVS